MKDEEARKQRAQRLHEQIDKLVRRGRTRSLPGEEHKEPGPRTPREFIHKRMRELAEKAAKK